MATVQLDRRTGYGTQGTPVTVLANTFALVQQCAPIVQHYDVSFKSGFPKKDMRIILRYMLQRMKIFGEVGTIAVFDGRANLYIPSRDIFPSRIYDVNENDARGRALPAGGQAPKPLQVEISHAATIDMNELATFVQQRVGPGPNIYQAINALNVAMKSPPSAKYPSRISTFYVGDTEADKRLISGGCEVWKGYFSSIRPAIGKLIWNFNTTAGCFRQPGSLIPILLKIANNRNGDVKDINLLDNTMPFKKRHKLKTFITGLTITNTARGADQKFKIMRVGTTNANNCFFTDASARKVSVTEYFKRTYNLTLRYPLLPVVQITKNAYIPMEVCNVVPGETFYGKLEPEQVAEMLKIPFVTLKPKDRMQALRNGMRYMEFGSKMHAAWNLKTAETPMQVQARVLPPPTLRYNAGKSPVTPRDGVWDPRSAKPTKAGKVVDRWCVVVFAGNGQQPGSNPYNSFLLKDAQDAVTRLVTACQAMGIVVQNQRPTIHYAGDTDAVRDAIITACKNAGYTPAQPPQLIATFCLVKNSRQYPLIKQFCDIGVGIATQNMVISKARGAKPSYWSNVALKVNVKLGGINQTIPDLFDKQATIVFGADVTHPPPGSYLPSIAAVVASHDLCATEYTTRISVQNSRLEILDDLHTLTLELMKNFKKKTTRKPERIVFFRDGVSEGQFDEVCRKEIAAIKRACFTIDPTYKPPLTYIVCGKRHHIRFCPLVENQGDRSGNVKAGTVVDRDIVHPYYDDFILNSHAGLLGTNRPTHYSVLLDESRLGPDILQRLTYFLAYLYPRCTRSVSIAAPAYFAHHVATRARLHIGEDDASDSGFGSGRKTKEEEEALRAKKLEESRAKMRAIHPNLVDTMYFM